MPNLLFLQSWYINKMPKAFLKLKKDGWNIKKIHEYDSSWNDFDKADVIYTSTANDQIFLKSIQKWFLNHLNNGGHLIINCHIYISWLPFLKIFQSVPPRPFTNMHARIRNSCGYFDNMDKEFDNWDGIYGMYGRGWSDPPKNAIRLCDIGTTEDPKPVDWCWQYQGGGKVFVHNGDCLTYFPDHGVYKENLAYDICLNIIK